MALGEARDLTCLLTCLQKLTPHVAPPCEVYTVFVYAKGRGK